MILGLYLFLSGICPSKTSLGVNGVSGSIPGRPDPKLSPFRNVWAFFVFLPELFIQRLGELFERAIDNGSCFIDLLGQEVSVNMNRGIASSKDCHDISVMYINWLVLWVN